MQGGPSFLFLVIGVILAGLALAALVAARKSNPKLQAAARALSLRMVGTVQLGSFHEDAAVAFTIEGRPARVVWDADGRTWLELKLAAPAPGVLHISPASEQESLRAKLPRGVSLDLEVGHPAFDAAYVVRAHPPGFADRLFAAERRDDVAGALMRLAETAAPRLDLSRDVLRLEWDRRVLDAGDLDRLIRTGWRMATWLAELRQVSEIVWVESGGKGAESGGALCQVCGTELKERVVTCRRCVTPHHLECWRYLTRCSTYACRETRFAGGPAPQEEVE